MTKKPSRFLEERGFVDPADLKQGPNGRPLCRFCGTETAPPRKTFCSDQCVHEFKIRSNGGYMREQVMLRDRGVCSGCGLDTEQLRQLLFRVKTEKGDEAYLKLVSKYKQMVGYTFDLERHFFEVDHIKPVQQGGGSCGLENLQTLCCACHRRKTRRERRRRTGKGRRWNPR